MVVIAGHNLIHAWKLSETKWEDMLRSMPILFKLELFFLFFQNERDIFRCCLESCAFGFESLFLFYYRQPIHSGIVLNLKV